MTRTAPKPPPTLDAPLLTILDLWYTRNGGRDVHFTYDEIEYADCDDWLMQNMALVVKGILRNGTYNKPDRALDVGHMSAESGPYRLLVIFDNTDQDILVRLMEAHHGDS